MSVIGTHAPLNEGLQDLAATLAMDNLYAAALYAVNGKNGFAAPVSSINFVTGRNTETYEERFHRAKLTPAFSAAAESMLKGRTGIEKSKAFDGHIVEHISLGNISAALQIVTTDGSAANLTASRKEIDALSERFNRIQDYKTQQNLGWDEIFGLKNAAQERWIMMSDVAGFSNATLAEQEFIERRFPTIATQLTEKYPLTITQIIGDEVRLRDSLAPTQKLADSTMKRHIRNFTKDLDTALAAETAELFGTQRRFALKTVAGKGMLAESFSGAYSDVRAPICYHGDILTRVANTMKEMPRDKTTLKFA